MRRADRAAAALERGSDGILDFAVLAFAGWTVVYHACLVLHLGVLVATVAEALLLVPAAWLALRWRGDDEPVEREPQGGLDLPAKARGALRFFNVAAALAGATLFAFGSASWRPVWLLWFLAAACGLLLATTTRRSPAQVDESRGGLLGSAWLSALTALAWAAGLAVLSLFLIRSSGDDAFYVHTSSWVAAHGSFPLRDTMFTDQALPAVIYPPVAAYEGLVGAVARLTGLAVPTLAYYGITFLATILAVLAVWRLLRSWRLSSVPLALTVAMVFLLLDAEAPRTFGSSFIGRIWQGKIIFLAVLVPLLWTFIGRYAERPGTRWLALLAAAGVAGVGLSSTGVFVVPVIALAGLAPLALSAPRRALTGFAAVAGYPLAAGIAILAVGGRHAQQYTDSDLALPHLVKYVLGGQTFALLGVTALLVAPALLPKLRDARMAAAAALLVTCLYAPKVPLLVFHVTGLGEVLWRLAWAIPVAALLGALAASVGGPLLPKPLRAVPALALVALMAVWGTAIWDAPGGQTIVSRPTLKRFPGDLVAARRVLALSRPGDLVLAPGSVSQTILVLSGDVTVVAPRPFYARALGDVPGGHAHDRLVLYAFAEGGLGEPLGTLGHDLDNVGAGDVLQALDDLGVDLACPNNGVPGARRLLLAAGYEQVLETGRVTCFRGPARPS